jgi:hypothetical protein
MELPRVHRSISLDIPHSPFSVFIVLVGLALEPYAIWFCELRCRDAMRRAFLFRPAREIYGDLAPL